MSLFEILCFKPNQLPEAAKYRRRPNKKAVSTRDPQIEQMARDPDAHNSS